MADIIEGRERIRVLRELKEDRTLIDIHLAGGSYRHLTLITGVRREGGRDCFCIDYPHGFGTAIAGRPRWQVRFEFVHRDGIQYFFQAGGVRIEGREVVLTLPETIERRQRRANFRLSAPEGTVIRLHGGEEIITLEVTNLSVGGLLATLRGSGRKLARQRRVLCPGALVHDLQLRVEAGSQSTEWHIREARVVRQQGQGRGRSLCALAFLDMDRKTEKRLIQWLYALQRAYLRRRLPTS